MLALAAQTSAGINPSSNPYLLRLQHQTDSLNACVLLQQDGDYHLERTYGDATSVFEGSLSTIELSNVNHWLNDGRLRQLTKENITEGVVPSTMDLLQLNVFRGDHWQDLMFPDAESQKPFEPLLTPLVSWIDSLQHAPHRELPEDRGKTNCKPPGKIELKVRSQPEGNDAHPTPSNAAMAVSASGAAAPQRPAQEPFLVRFESIRFENQQAERTCVVIYPGARYHLEKSTQEIRRIRDLFDPKVAITGSAKTQVYQGLFETKRLQDLRPLLDDPKLMSLEKGNLAESSVVWTTEIVRVAIFRGNHVQRLEFMDPVHFFDPGGNGILLHDSNLRYIRPIQKWIKAEIQPSGASLLPGALPNRCAIE
ncbi:MAG: hypothetical protein WAN70_07130 [Terriglobales bacterium]